MPVLALEKMKVTHFREVPDRVSFFFTDEYPYDPEAVEKTLRKPGALDRLAQLARRLSPRSTPGTPRRSKRS